MAVPSSQPRCRSFWHDLTRRLSFAAVCMLSTAADAAHISQADGQLSQTLISSDFGLQSLERKADVDDGSSHDVSEVELPIASSELTEEADSVLYYNFDYGISEDGKPDPPDCSDMSKTGNRLECWLWNLKVGIDDQSFRKDFVSISIEGMVCSNFKISNLNTTYQQSTEDTLPRLGVDVSGISATCRGKYKSGLVSGKVEASVTSATDGLVLCVDIGSTFWNGTDLVTNSTDQTFDVPANIHTADCATNIVVPKGGIKFSGSASAKIIDLFSGTIGKYISSAISDQVCPAATKAVDPFVNKYLGEADQAMVKILKEIVEPIPKEYFESEIDHFAVSSKRSLTASTIAVGRSNGLRRRIEQAAGWMANALLGEGSNFTYPTQLPVVYTLSMIANQLIRENLNQSMMFRHWLPAPCDEADCGYFFRGITGMMESYLNGTIKIKMPKMFQNMTYTLPSDSGVTVTLSINRVIVSGLSQIEDLIVAGVANVSSTDADDSSLQPDSDDISNSSSSRGRSETFHNSINASQWTVTAQMDLRVDAKPGASTFHGNPLEESFHLVLDIESIEAIADTLVKVHGWEKLTVLQVVYAVRDIVTGPPSKRKAAIECIVTSFQSAKVLPTHLLAHILLGSASIIPDSPESDIDIMSRLWSLEDDLDNLVNTVSRLVMTEYQPLVTSLIQGASVGPLRRLLNKYALDNIEKWGGGNDSPFNDATCSPDAAPSEQPHWVNFTSLTFLNTMNRYLNKPKSLKSLNHYIDCIARIIINHRRVDMQHSSIMGDSSDADNHSFGISVRDVQLNNLGGLQDLKFLSPSSSSTGDFDEDTFLLTSASWGHQPGKIPQAFLSLGVSYPMLDTHGVVNFTVYVGDVDVELGSRLSYDLNRLSNISVADLLTRGQCAFVPSSELRILPSRSAITIGQIGVNVSASLLRNGNPLNVSASTDEYPIVQDFLSALGNWSFGVGRQASNKVIEKLVSSAANLCRDKILPPDSSEDDSENEELSPLIYLVGILFFVGQAGVLIVSKNSGSNYDDEEYYEMDEGSGLLSELIRLPPDEAGNNDDTPPAVMNAPIDEDDTPPRASLEKELSLFLSPEIPEFLRHFIPIVIVGTIFLLLSGNLTTGASVDLKISVGGEYELNVPSVFTFSFGHTVQQMYQAGIYPLLFLVVSFSGVWPYGKLLLMLHAWMAPSSNLRKRERLLLTLDALGKFSLVDTYVLVVMLVSFRCHLKLSEGSGLDVFVTPQHGFYGFLIATSLSLVIGHAMVYYHRRTQNPPVILSDTQESLCSHHYDVGQDGSRSRLSVLLQLLLFCSALAAAIFMAIGFNKESFIFETGGLAGILLGDKSRHAYSLISLGASLSKSVETPSFGIWFLQAAFFFYAVVTPLLCLVLLMTLLIHPMNLKTQMKVLVLAEIANAWSAVEVFALSIIAALLQISTFASFFVGHNCDIINGVLEKYFPDQFPVGEAVCYTVKSSVSWDCWYLVAGVLLNSFTVSILLRVAHAAIDERMRSSGNIFAVQDQPETTTIVSALYKLPLRSLFFVTEVVDEQEVEEEEEQEDAPAWRHWF